MGRHRFGFVAPPCRVAAPTAKVLLARFLEHASDLKTTRFVANNKAALEGWLHAELCTVLATLGHPPETIRVNTGPPGTKARIDIFAGTGPTALGIEVKCFRRDTYTPEIREFPAQLKRMAEFQHQGLMGHAFGFASFHGWEGQELAAFVKRVQLPGWRVAGPSPMLNGLPKHVAAFELAA